MGGQQTRETPLLHEVTLEWRVSEQEVMELVYTEAENFIHILSATQVLVEGLHLPCMGQKKIGSVWRLSTWDG